MTLLPVRDSFFSFLLRLSLLHFRKFPFLELLGAQPSQLRHDWESIHQGWPCFGIGSED
jgi:hypothetical protein